MTKSAAWVPHRLDQYISLLLGFLTLESGLYILGVLVGSLLFVESFISKVL
jgi:hypothetical protein